MTDEIKQAERRGYSKGYSAAKRTTKVKRQREQAVARKNALWQRCFVAAIPSFLMSASWTSNGKEMRNLEDRIEMARIAADRALAVTQRHGRL